MIEKNSSSTHNLQKKFQEWFRDSVPADLPFSTEVDQPYYKTRRKRVYDLKSLLEMFNIACGTAIFTGASVGFIVLLISFSQYGWIFADWSDQLFVIFMAMLIGFFGGVYLGYKYVLSKGNFSKDEF